MSVTRRQPWPRSWPPFRRAALHVVIATVTTTFFLLVAVIGGAEIGPLVQGGDRLLLIVLLATVAAGLPVLLCAGLARTSGRTALRLLAAYVLGAVVAALLSEYADSRLYWFFAWRCNYWLPVRAKPQLVGIVGSTWSIVWGFLAAMATLALLDRRLRMRRALFIATGGVLLFWLSGMCALLVFLACRAVGRPQILSVVFFSTMPVCLLPLSIVITARMLIGAVEHEEKDGESIK